MAGCLLQFGASTGGCCSPGRGGGRRGGGACRWRQAGLWHRLGRGSGSACWSLFALRVPSELAVCCGGVSLVTQGCLVAC